MRRFLLIFILVVGCVSANILPPRGTGEGGGGSDGDMQKNVYDKDYNGIVDNAEKVYGKTEAQLKEDVATETDLAGKSNVGHTHVISDITDSETILAGKSNVGHTHNITDIVGYRQKAMGSFGANDTLSLYDGARITLYELSVSADIEIEGVQLYAGKVALDGDTLILRVYASGDDRTITFKTDVAGSFAFGKTLTADDIGTIEQGTTTIIGCQYSSNKERWLILAISEGF